MADIKQINVQGALYDIKDAVARNDKLDKIVKGNVGTAEGGGQYMYCLLATLTIQTAYINRPVVFEISGRHRLFSIVQIMFNSTNSTDPALNTFISSQDITFWLYKSGTSTWQLYGGFSEMWGNMIIHRITGAGALNSGIAITVNCNSVSSLPSGATQASLPNLFVKKTGDDMTGTINMRYATAKGTNPSSDEYRRLTFLDNSGTADADRVGLVESKWASGGNTSLLLRTYSSANENKFIGIAIHYPVSGNPYVQVTGCTNVNNVVRNIWTGTGAPNDSSGSDGEVYLRYTA